MTKQQSIERVAAKTELVKADVEVAVDSILEPITEKLRSNERVDLRGLGSLIVKDKKERQGRNPRTGETITIARKTGCALQAQQGTDGKAGSRRDTYEYGRGRMMQSEEAGRAANAGDQNGIMVDFGGALWLR
jgi:DNA-binding protein HU-beta